jgi:hypothetical protein
MEKHQPAGCCIARGVCQQGFPGEDGQHRKDAEGLCSNDACGQACCKTKTKEGPAHPYKKEEEGREKRPQETEGQQAQKYKKDQNAPQKIAREKIAGNISVPADRGAEDAMTGVLPKGLWPCRSASQKLRQLSFQNVLV